MAVSFDDKMLGEKPHYYCSSSEEEDSDNEAKGEDDGDDGGGGGGGAAADATRAPKLAPPPPECSSGGNTHNTGPKGVIKDWQRYKQLESEKRAEADREKIALAKKLALTCRTDAEDQAAKEREIKADQDLEALLDADFLESYMERRMRDMCTVAQQRTTKRFGRVLDLADGDEFLRALDAEDNADVIVIVYIYEKGVAGCDNMSACIETIAKDYPTVKFCRIRASAAGLSRLFKASGVPALIVYKGGELISSFVRISEALGGDDFFASDVESYLIEHGVLTDRSLVPPIIRGPAVTTNDSDSD